MLQKELENWRSSNYSAISREFADNARFVFRSLEERSLHGNYITDRPDGKVTDSVGARRAEQILHFRTFPIFLIVFFFFGPVNATEAFGTRQKSHTRARRKKFPSSNSAESSLVMNTRVSGKALPNKNSSAPPFDAICYDLDCA